MGRVKAIWSHLMADTTVELEEFASKLGLSPKWIQYPGTWKEHYDVTDTVRKKAIKLGAKPVAYSSREMHDMRQRKRKALEN